MKTMSAEQAENEAARNWCASLLTEDGLSTKDATAKRWIKIGVETLLDICEDDEMSDDEKVRRCDAIYAAAEDSSPSFPTVCVVDGEEYRTCRDCPLWVG